MQEETPEFVLIALEVWTFLLRKLLLLIWCLVQKRKENNHTYCYHSSFDIHAKRDNETGS